jgi:hypothetical protein
MPVDKARERRRIAMRVAVHAMLFAVAATGTSSALAQGDSGAAKRNPYGLDAAGSGQSSGQRLRLPGGDEDQKKEKRGNTPPGSDRAGDAPASGPIVDPAGVTKK